MRGAFLDSTEQVFDAAIDAVGFLGFLLLFALFVMSVAFASMIAASTTRLPAFAAVSSLVIGSALRQIP